MASARIKELIYKYQHLSIDYMVAYGKLLKLTINNERRTKVHISTVNDYNKYISYSITVGIILNISLKTSNRFLNRTQSMAVKR